MPILLIAIAILVTLAFFTILTILKKANVAGV